jgi:hypothetical protein
MVDGLCAIQILQRAFARRGLIAKGGAYMLEYTVVANSDKDCMWDLVEIFKNCVHPCGCWCSGLSSELG